MTATRWELEISLASGACEQRSVESASDTIRLGRAGVNDVVLASKAVSSEHAALRWTDDGIWTQDRGSRHGTFRGTERVPREWTRVGPGETLWLGDVEIRVLRAHSAAVPALLAMEHGEWAMAFSLRGGVSDTLTATDLRGFAPLQARAPWTCVRADGAVRALRDVFGAEVELGWAPRSVDGVRVGLVDGEDSMASVIAPRWANAVAPGPSVPAGGGVDEAASVPRSPGADAAPPRPPRRGATSVAAIVLGALCLAAGALAATWALRG